LPPYLKFVFLSLFAPLLFIFTLVLSPFFGSCGFHL
jgi:hypothetical protein